MTFFFVLAIFRVYLATYAYRKELAILDWPVTRTLETLNDTLTVVRDGLGACSTSASFPSSDYCPFSLHLIFFFYLKYWQIWQVRVLLLVLWCNPTILSNLIYLIKVNFDVGSLYWKTRAGTRKRKRSETRDTTGGTDRRCHLEWTNISSNGIDGLLGIYCVLLETWTMRKRDQIPGQYASLMLSRRKDDKGTRPFVNSCFRNDHQVN